MDKTYKLFTINPGSTSTKIALFENDKKVYAVNVTHDAEKLKEFKEISDQYPYRKQTILDLLAKENISLTGTDAFVARGGGLVGLVGGTYTCNEKLLEHARVGFTVKHPNTLASQLADDFARTYGGKAFVVNPPDVDELQDLARITGMKDVFRESKGHPLNQKEVAIRHAASLGKKYEEMNFVISHIGGGVSVNAHKKGRMIDGTDVINGDGPMAPTRAGAMPATAIARMCFSGNYTLDDIYKRLTKGGGLVDHLGTSEALEVVAMIEKGDQYAKLIYDALAYQIGKYIGMYAAVLHGDVDAILLTGGIAHDKDLTAKVAEMVKFIAPVTVVAGEFEMEALAAGALRVLTGQEEALEYTGIPVFQGFKF